MKQNQGQKKLIITARKRVINDGRGPFLIPAHKI